MKAPVTVKHIFDSWAGQERGASMAHNHRELFEAMVMDWNVDSQMRILDVACGNGFALDLLGKLGFNQLYGIDFSEKMIDEAKRNCEYAELRVGAMESLPWPDQSFDRVYSIEAIYYSTDLAKTLDEMRRVLKSHGSVDVVIEYFRENTGSLAWEAALGAELILLSSDEWIQCFRDAGFENPVARRIVRKNMRSEKEFTPDSFFPSYEVYKAYKKEGALQIRNYGYDKIP